MHSTIDNVVGLVFLAIFIFVAWSVLTYKAPYDESVYTYDDFVSNFVFGEHRLDGTEIVKEPKEFDGVGL